MRYSIISCLLIVLASGCNSSDMKTKLLAEQKILKDSTSHVVDRIESYMQRAVYDSAEIGKIQIAGIQTRLIAIQSWLDSLE